MNEREATAKARWTASVTRKLARKLTVPDVLPLVQKYYDANPGGGTLHIYLDDGNHEADTLMWCAQFANEQGDQEGARLALFLAQMSDTQRLKIYNSLDRSR